MEQILIGLNWSLQRSTGWARERNEEAIRTWASRGETPALGKTLSAVAGITFLSFYFRLYAGPVKAPHLIDFLQARQRSIPRPLTVVWDGLPAHCSRLVRGSLQTLNGRIRTEFLPSDVPELKRVLQTPIYLPRTCRTISLPMALPYNWTNHAVSWLDTSLPQCIACGDKLRLIAARRARKWRYD